MKVEFYCNSGANIHSCRRELVDLEDFGITDDDWHGMTDDEKYAVAKEWAEDRLEIGWKD